MKLKKVVIEDFKSIKKLELNLHDLTCLVGQNESGKSNLLEAISYLNFLKNKLTPTLLNKNSAKYETEGFPTIIGHFEISETDSSNLQILSYDHGISDNLILTANELILTISSSDISGVQIKFIAQTKSTELTRIIPEPEKRYNFVIALLNSLIPKIELFTSDDLELTPISFQQIQEADFKQTAFGKLFQIGGINSFEILVGDPERGYDKVRYAQDKITELFLEFYKQDPSLRIEIVQYNNTWLVKFRDASNRSYSLKERSVGFRYFFAFFINKYHAIENSESDIIYLLDEPGISLHPKGARDLLKLFDEIIATEQIVYSTHNPFLTLRGNPDKLLLVKRDPINGSVIYSKSYSNKYEILRKELGLLLNDSFLVGEFNIVVEGVSDKYVLHQLIEEIDEFESLKWLNIFSSDSSSEVISSVRFLQSLGLRGIILFDDDDASKKEIEKGRFKELINSGKHWDYIKVTGTNDANYSQKTIEDVFDQGDYIKAYNSYYSTEFESCDPVKPFVPLREKSYAVPILNTIKKHHNEYFGTEQINKVAVFRKLFDTVPISDNEPKYSHAILLLKRLNHAINAILNA